MKYDVMSQVLKKMAKELNAANVVPITALAIRSNFSMLYVTFYFAMLKDLLVLNF